MSFQTWEPLNPFQPGLLWCSTTPHAQQLKREYEKMLLRDLDFVGFSGEVDDLKLSATEFRFGAEQIFSFVEMARGLV